MLMPIGSNYKVGSGGGAPAISLTYEDEGRNTNGTTISNISFGADDPARTVIVGVYARYFGGALTDVTIGGQTADIYSLTTSGAHSVCIAVAQPSGTSGNITMSGSGFGPGISVVCWSALNLTSTTPIDHDSSSTTGSSNSVTLTGDASTDAAFVGFLWHESGANYAVSWNSPLTEQYDAQGYSGASVVQTAATENVGYNLAQSGTKLLVGASFK